MKILAFIVVLSLVGVQGANKFENKSGRCPQLIDFMLGAKCDNPCKSDKDCRGTEKCCLSDCGAPECMQPIEKKPEHNCDIPCTRELDPVCGTDNVTYPTWCMLNFTTCTRNQLWIKLDYKGSCRDMTDVCQLIPGQTGPCQGDLLRYNEQALIGGRRPQCDDKSFYLPKQCSGSTGSCHCVDCMGNVIPAPPEIEITKESCLELRRNY